MPLFGGDEDSVYTRQKLLERLPPVLNVALPYSEVSRCVSRDDRELAKVES